ncbi:MAG: TetR family transcriptional regulator [Clostridium perfringens]|nr:TetR family transcriptional regulator [Clostridium perfringens]
MSFQRARTEEQILIRQNEIIKACDLIFTTKGYEEVNFKAISEITSFTRPTIYKYYETREEIFLDLLTTEYLNWKDELKNTFDNTESVTKEDYCRLLTNSLINHKKMLQLLSLHLVEIENNSRLERLVEFKKQVLTVGNVFSDSLNKYFPHGTEEDKFEFQMQFFTYIYGLYPYTHHSTKQIKAMELANIPFTELKFEDFCYNGLILLISKL